MRVCGMPEPTAAWRQNRNCRGAYVDRCERYLQQLVHIWPTLREVLNASGGRINLTDRAANDGCFDDGLSMFEFRLVYRPFQITGLFIITDRY